MMELKKLKDTLTGCKVESAEEVDLHRNKF